MSATKDRFESLQTLEDAQKLIDDEERESVTLEYKEAVKQWDDKAKKKIAKHISAFANSEGGVIIFGIECDKKDEDKPIAITGLHPKNSAETFDRILTDAVKPEIEGWERKVLSGAGKSVLVVAIPRSDRAPHMSQKHKQYFHRSGAQSLAMESHLVELYYGRRRKPALDLKVVEPLKQVESAKQGFTGTFVFGIYLDNLGTGMASGASGVIRFPRKDLFTINHYAQKFAAVEEVHERDPVNRPLPRYYFDIETKIFPKSTRCILHFNIAFKEEWRTQYADKPLFEWEIYAEDAEPKSGKYEVSQSLLRTFQQGNCLAASAG